MTDKADIPYFSMFSGIGGFELGLQNASNRFKCVGYSEIDKFAIRTYESHFKGVKNYGDATKIKPDQLPRFDLLTGGFPCQAFSISGNRLGFKDNRGNLFFEIYRVIRARKPRIVFLENVKGLLSHSEGRTFAVILSKMDELGYNVEWEVLNSKHFGVPQNRERVFIIGHIRGESFRQIFPLFKSDSENKELCGKSLKTYQKSHFQTGRVYQVDGISPSIITPSGGNHLPIILSNQPRTGDPFKGGTGLLASDEYSFTIDTKPHLVLPAITLELSKSYGKYQSPKILDILEQNGTNLRRITPIECERLQGFPDNWTLGSDTARYRQLGNAVTTNVITEIGKEIEKNVFC